MHGQQNVRRLYIFTFCWIIIDKNFVPRFQFHQFSIGIATCHFFQDSEQSGLRNEGLEEPVLRNEGLEEPALRNEGLEEPVLRNEGLEEPILRNEGLEEPVLRKDLNIQ